MEEVTLLKGSRIKPKYKLLVNKLSRDILSGAYHHRIPGLRELARKHQVHLKTMAKAVNILVEKGLLYREKGIGTFINEEIVKNKLLTIWLLSEKWEEGLGSLRSELVRGLREGLKEGGREVEFRMVEMESVKKGVWEESFREGIFQGVITTGITLKYKEDIKRMIEEEIPCISLLFREEGVNYVDADNIGGAYKAVKYLISLGHRNIAFLTGNLEAPNMRDNLLGYRKALGEGGAKYRKEWVKETKSLYPQEISEITKELIKKSPQITAFFTSGDLIAVEVVRTLKEMGLKVPEDFSVVGFDDLPLGRYSHPSLTTVYQPFYEVGKLSARRFLELVEGKRQKIEEILPTELKIRESTGKVRKKNLRLKKGKEVR